MPEAILSKIQPFLLLLVYVLCSWTIIEDKKKEKDQPKERCLWA